MPILKRTNFDTYVVIPNTLAQNSSLTFEARGLLVNLLSLPENWVIYKSFFMRDKSNPNDVRPGRIVVDRIFKELRTANYLYIYNIYHNNKIIDRAWIASPEPLTKDEFKAIGNKHDSFLVALALENKNP